ncbi:hypothetical protein Tco_0605300 [Tanacetum coccineum]
MTRRHEESTKECGIYTRSTLRRSTKLNGRRAYNGRALMDFYWLISDKPELLISSFEHFSFCLAEALYDDVLVLENCKTEEEDVKEDEFDHNKERYIFEEDDDDGEFDDLD